MNTIDQHFMLVNNKIFDRTDYKFLGFFKADDVPTFDVLQNLKKRVDDVYKLFDSGDVAYLPYDKIKPILSIMHVLTPSQKQLNYFMSCLSYRGNKKYNHTTDEIKFNDVDGKIFMVGTCKFICFSSDKNPMTHCSYIDLASLQSGITSQCNKVDVNDDMRHKLLSLYFTPYLCYPDVFTIKKMKT